MERYLCDEFEEIVGDLRQILPQDKEKILARLWEIRNETIEAIAKSETLKSRQLELLFKKQK